MMMLCLKLLIAILNCAILCNSVAIDNFVVTNPARTNEYVWINCTGHTDTGQEKFEGIELLKDGAQFYMYSDNETNKIRTTGVRGIELTQMDTFVNYPGSVRIKNATDSIKGEYACFYWFLLEGKYHRWTNRGGQEITSVIVGPNNPVINPPTGAPTISPPTYNDTAVINNFDASDPITVGDDFSLNCTPGLIAGQSLLSLTISKDNAVFYNYSDNKVKPRGVLGINIFQILYPKNSSGSVIISAAQPQASGIYKCELTIKSLNGTTISAYLVKNINVTNIWSPVINSFDTPSVITKDSDFWINCTYNPTISEKLVSLNWSKDGQVFYSYSNAKMHVNTNSAINVYKIITAKEVGSVKIESAIESYRGKYRCSITAQKNNSAGTIEGTTSSEAFIDYTEVKNHYINNFQVPSKFGKGDDLLINCSLALESGVTLTSLTISKDDRAFYTYRTSSDKPDVIRLPEIPALNQIKTNKEQIGVITILYATQELKGNYECIAYFNSTKSGTVFESVSKYVGFTDEWKPDINRFYVPDNIKRGANDFWVNCSSRLTAEEMSNFQLTLTKDSEIFYNISSISEAQIFSVSGIETYQFVVSSNFNGSVRIKDPTIEAKGIYRCTLTTTRSGESKSVYKEWFVNFNRATALIISTSMYFVIAFAIYFNL